MKLKTSVYAVVNKVTGDVIDVSYNRDMARSSLQYFKGYVDNPNQLKIAKLSTVEKFVR